MSRGKANLEVEARQEPPVVIHNHGTRNFGVDAESMRRRATNGEMMRSPQAV
ncbi:MAG: hypothetical protein KJ749_15750 [Planctomycetes bacterium]|nr:hypothetical protein [Planctomycetota bacterium]